MSENISVQRRFPTYDFILPLPLSVNEASAKLESFLSHQPRPRGFVLSDPRVDGVISGATFSLRSRESGFSGSVAPYAEGYFVPAESGCNAFVRVQVSPWWWLFDVVVLLAVMSTFDFRTSFESVATLMIMAMVTLAFSILPVWSEASQIARLLERVLVRDVPVIQSLY